MFLCCVLVLRFWFLVCDRVVVIVGVVGGMKMGFCVFGRMVVCVCVFQLSKLDLGGFFLVMRCVFVSGAVILGLVSSR